MSGTSSVESVDAAADPATQRGRRRAGRATLAIAATVLVAAAAATGLVAWNRPSGRDAEEPGPILDLAARVHVHDVTATKINGAFDGLTVSIRPLTLGDEVMHAITRNPATIVPDAEVHPAEVPIATYHKIEKSAYVDGGQIAAGVAERAIGDQVTITADGLTVAAVEAGGPASHALRTGDRITAVDGTPAESSDDLAAAIQRSSRQALSLTVDDGAGSKPRAVSISPVASGADGRLVIGVVVDPSNVEVHLQVPVTIDASGVEGPSAGLMTALTVYDELSPVDLAGGRRIAGTGTLDTEGNVGAIGGIQAKARAAVAAGADLFLAPASQAADAQAVLGTRIPVIGVTTFQQTLSALSAAPAHTPRT